MRNRRFFFSSRYSRKALSWWKDHFELNYWQLFPSNSFIYEVYGQLLLQHYIRELKCSLCFWNFFIVLALQQVTIRLGLKKKFFEGHLSTWYRCDAARAPINNFMPVLKNESMTMGGYWFFFRESLILYQASDCDRSRSGIRIIHPNRPNYTQHPSQWDHEPSLIFLK